MKRSPIGLQGDIKPTLKFSPDGKLLASKDGSNVRLWDVTVGKQIYQLSANGVNPQIALVPAPGPAPGGIGNGPWPGRPDNLAFTPDGRVLAVGHAGSGAMSKSSVRLWETLTGKLIREIPTAASVLAMAFSPDGKTLALGGGSMPYRGIGVDLPECRQFRGHPARDEIVLWPSHVRKSAAIRNLDRKSTRLNSSHRT